MKEEKDRKMGVVPQQQEALLKAKGTMEREVGQHGCMFSFGHIQLLGTGV